MLTPYAERLIYDLRNNEDVRVEFDMGDWVQRGTAHRCGTVGCLAGTAVIYKFRERYGITPALPNDIHKFATYLSGQEVGHAAYAFAGAKLLGIGSPHAAQHLFLPIVWYQDLTERKVEHLAEIFSIGTNSGASMDTVEKMKQFARRNKDAFSTSHISPDTAANALEGVLLSHPGYCDWHEAHVKAGEYV